MTSSRTTPGPSTFIKCMANIKGEGGYAEDNEHFGELANI